MNKLIRLSPTGIEYGDYAWNFASGCGNNIDGKCKSGRFKCWAYSICQRFEGHYPNGFKPTVYPDALLSPLYLKKPSLILCCFMGDLFWDCPEFNPDRVVEVKMPSGFVDHDTLKAWIFNAVNYCPQHTFLFLTKQPQNLIKWSPFPDNCFVGQTITQNLDGIGYMADVQARLKYISFEPLLYYDVDPLTASELFRVNGIGWIIIGSQTKPYRPPHIEEIKKVVEAADRAGIPVFLKNNLKPLLTSKLGNDDVIESHNLWAFKYFKLRQELPDA